MRWRRSIGSVWGGLLAASLGVGSALGQQAASAPAPASPSSGESHSVTDLVTKFRFAEHYEKTEKSSSGSIGQYRVVTSDTIKVATDKAQGTPERTEATQETDYRERPAQLTGGDQIRAGVREYASYRITPNPNTKPSRADPLKGLMIWYQPHEGGDPLVLSLTKGRGLREDEYTIIRREIFLPDLAALLPTIPTRVGDRWTASKTAGRALLGSIALPLTATLQQVRQAAEGPNWEAVIGVTGRSPARSNLGSMAVNARLVFSFAPPPESKDGEKEEKLVDARGAIVELRMATSAVTPLPPSGRLRQSVTRELIIDRRIDDTGAALPLPEPAPVATEENSWLSYDDPQGKFHFRYPQEFRPGRPPDDLSMELVRLRPGGPDTLEFQRVIKTGDAEADRLNRDPEFHLKMLKEEWRQNKFNVIPGPHAWLPEANWAATNRKVYRAESVLKGAATNGKGELRVHNDLYFVLFGRNESLVVTSNTVQDPATPFRNQVEAIIRTFDFGPTEAH
ncbi:hypothetical protein [Singulisphaera acidiphila]|uniref:DUF1795 domain-containing protein n=1 Tax=Singulisphaera acidiphila (strain ATCC BAA-1392 / DSM 18658 / VKM B-2454 / MOB10) TaxID=886293 RepID=L0D6U0_SINAD|nr:hypothetical protein [Singulisphaera acidiphila]AGA24947.1 hypothetical protein Sinac_0517 [Singulisphaera acidiphila DSM 18658]